jgi:leucyl-tRNA synthetase
VIWTEEGVQGAHRFVQRLWRLVGEVADVAPAPVARPGGFGEAALALRKAAHRALIATEEDVERLRFNRCVAHAYELANALQTAIATCETAPGPDLAYAMREAAEMLVQIVAPMMPHLAEECWAELGHADLVSAAPWPEADRALVVEDVITLPVQVNGKKRADITVARDADSRTIEAAVLELDAVRRAMEGKPAKKVIVVPQRIVNVVA